MAAVTVLLFLTSTVFAALVAPTATVPKSRDLTLGVAEGTPVADICTARGLGRLLPSCSIFTKPSSAPFNVGRKELPTAQLCKGARVKLLSGQLRGTARFLENWLL